MGQVYYTIEKMVGGIYRTAIPADFGEEPDPGGGEKEFATEQEAHAEVARLREGKGGNGKGGGKAGERPAPGGSYRVVQKYRLQSGFIGAPSAPGALDPPVVSRDTERLKKARDERRKVEDEQYERDGYIAPDSSDVRRREVSGTPLHMGMEDRVTSTADPGGQRGSVGEGGAVKAARSPRAADAHPPRRRGRPDEHATPTGRDPGARPAQPAP